jgi:ribose 5-phosphate isomerase A
VGIPLLPNDDLPDEIAITFDGADEVDPAWNLTKGGGGSLLREKIVAQASRQLVIMVDDSKVVDRLGASFPIPIDVVPFGWASHLRFLRELGVEPRLRRLIDGGVVRTDEGNFILDLDLRKQGGVPDLLAFHARLSSRVGIVETGIFLGLATAVIVGRADGADQLRRG